MKVKSMVRIRYTITNSWGMSTNVMWDILPREKSVALEKIKRKKRTKLIDITDINAAIPSQRDITDALKSFS